MELFYVSESIVLVYLVRATQVKNEQLVNNINDGLIDLRNAINRKEIPQNENPNKTADIVRKILDKKVQEIKH